MDNRDSIDFANEPVGQLFRKMLWPTIISMISIVILNIADGAFLGHGAGSEALAGVNIAAPIFNIMMGIGIMFGIGSSIVASIHLSRGQVKAANINITQAILGSLTIAVILSILILTNLPATCRLFGSNDELIPLASSYLKWVAIAEPLIMIEMVCRFIIRIDGSPNYAMICSVAASTLNIILDYVAIFILGWGLEGAAIATSVSFALSGIAQLIYMIWFTKVLSLYKLKLTIKSLMLTLRNLGYQIKMGFSAMVGEIAVSGSMIIGNYVFIHYLGETGVAAYSVACYSIPFIFLMANGIAQAGQPIVSYAYGADNKERLHESYRLMIRWAVIAGALLSAIMYFMAPYVTMIFLEESDPAFQISADGLPYYGLGILVITLNIVLIGYMQSIEQSTRASIYSILRGFVIVIPCFILLPKLIGQIGMWLAIPVAEAITLGIIMISWKRK